MINIRRFHEIKQVVLTPAVKDPMVRCEFDYDEPDYFSRYDCGSLQYRTPIKDDLIFARNDWRISIETGPIEKFEKVAAIVGDEKAYEVLEALKL